MTTKLIKDIKGWIKAYEEDVLNKDEEIWLLEDAYALLCRVMASQLEGGD